MEEEISDASVASAVLQSLLVLRQSGMCNTATAHEARPRGFLTQAAGLRYQLYLERRGNTERAHAYRGQAGTGTRTFAAQLAGVCKLENSAQRAAVLGEIRERKRCSLHRRARASSAGDCVGVDDGAARGWH